MKWTELVSLKKIVKGAVIRELVNGITPRRMEIKGNLPFNFQKSEEVVWVFRNVDYYEQKNSTHYVGGSRGVSIRIMKGVYYRTSGFKGERIQKPEIVFSDTGMLAITDKHIYFAGSFQGFRINYNKIVTFSPFEDGIGVQRDALTAKPQLFCTGDGWFTYNLVVNLAEM